jgi:hypothetical protein
MMVKTCLPYKLHSHTLSTLRLLPSYMSDMYSISKMPNCYIDIKMSIVNS